MGPGDTVLHERVIDAGTAGGILGLAGNDRFGAAVAGPGDLDGNGLPDLIVGAPGRDGSGFADGSVFVLFLAPGGLIAGFHEISVAGGDLAPYVGETSRLGESLAMADDIDGDGRPDVFAGAPGQTGEHPSGLVLNLFLEADGSVRDARVISAFTGGLGPVQEASRFGHSLSATGALDDDTRRLLFVGAPDDDEGGSDQGAVWTLELGLRTWHDLGLGLPGFLGTPQLTGTGVLQPDHTVRLNLAAAFPNTTAWFVIGFARADLPFAGGTLVPDPAPPALLLPLPTGPGSLTLEGVWPAGVPDLFETFFQVWVVDPSGPQGYTASNALKGVAG